MRSLGFVHCYHATGFSVRVPHMSASGFSVLVQYVAALDLSVRVTSVTCIVSVGFDHFYLCFCRHGVQQKNRKAASLIKCQSSVLCDLQVQHVNCIKSWSV